MNVKIFAKRLAKELQVDTANVTPDTLLTNIPGFDSMGRLVVLAFLDAEFDVLLDADELMQAIKVSDLMGIVERKQKENMGKS